MLALHSAYLGLITGHSQEEALGTLPGVSLSTQNKQTKPEIK